MENEIYFENGIHHKFTEEEINLLRLLVKYHANETAKQFDISGDAVVLLKTLFFEKSN